MRGKYNVSILRRRKCHMNIFINSIVINLGDPSTIQSLALIVLNVVWRVIDKKYSSK